MVTQLPAVQVQGSQQLLTQTRGSWSLQCQAPEDKLRQKPAGMELAQANL